MPGVRGGAAVDVDDADLAVVAALVLLEQPLQGDRGGGAVVEVGERQALVGDVGVGLGGDGADPGHGGRHGGPDGQELGGDGHAPRLAVGGPGHDREGHGREDSEPDAARPIPACPQAGLEVGGCDGCSQRLGFPSVGRHRRFVTAIAIDAVGSGVCMPVSMLYFLATTDLTPRAGRRRDLAGLRGRAAGRAADRRAWSTGSAPSSVLQAGNAAAGASASWRTSSPTRSSRVTLWTVVVTVGPDRVLGLLRQHRRRDLGAGGAGEVVRLPRARCATSGFARRRAASPGSRSRSARRAAYAAVVVANAASYVVAFVLLLGGAGRPPRAGAPSRRRGLGRRCCATGPTGCCGAAQLAYSMSMMVLNFAMPVYATTVLGPARLGAPARCSRSTP